MSFQTGRGFRRVEAGLNGQGLKGRVMQKLNHPPLPGLDFRRDIHPRAQVHLLAVKQDVFLSQSEGGPVVAATFFVGDRIFCHHICCTDSSTRPLPHYRCADSARLALRPSRNKRERLWRFFVSSDAFFAALVAFFQVQSACGAQLSSASSDGIHSAKLNFMVLVSSLFHPVRSASDRPVLS